MIWVIFVVEKEKILSKGKKEIDNDKFIKFLYKKYPSSWPFVNLSDTHILVTRWGGGGGGGNSTLKLPSCVSIKVMDMGPFSAPSELSERTYFHSKWASKVSTPHYSLFTLYGTLLNSVICICRLTLHHMGKG